MTLQDLGNIGEFLGSIGVIVTLIYLAIQIRQNTKAVRASSAAESQYVFANTNEWLLENPEVHLLINRTLSEKSRVPDFSDEEKETIRSFGRMIFQRYEALYFLYREGHLSKDIWKVRSQSARTVIEFPVWKSYWREETQQPYFTSEFVKEIESIEPGQITTSLTDGI